MKLHEYITKARFSEFGIPIPEGYIAHTPAEVRQIAERLNVPVVIKAQVLSSGRGQVGGVRLAHSPHEAEAIATEILGLAVRGHIVRRTLVEPAAKVQQEIYLAITHDRHEGRPIFIASSTGGMALEEASRVDPATIIRDHIDPHIGLLRYQVTNIASNMYLAREYWRPLTRIAQDLYRCFVESDATLAEINPLAITEDGDLIALDGKMIIDDNALFRQKEMAAHRDTEAEADAETRARKVGLSYVHLEGQIGCMVNGAGLAMALMDMIKAYGAQDGITPANFLDIGGGATANKVTAGLEIILSVPDVRTVVLNIFGGITRCDEVAQGIITTYENLRPSIPLIVRLQGTNMAEGRAILRSSGIESLIYAETLTEIARKAVEAARGVQV